MELSPDYRVLAKQMADPASAAWRRSMQRAFDGAELAEVEQRVIAGACEVMGAERSVLNRGPLAGRAIDIEGPRGGSACSDAGDSACRSLLTISFGE
jgi:hypothetical protein